jgi:hypothetical protein
MLVHKENLWLENDVEQESTAPNYSAPARYSADYLRETQPAAPPVVHLGFGSDGETSFILRSQGGRELKRVSATTEDSADERPVGLFCALARLMYGSRR